MLAVVTSRLGRVTGRAGRVLCAAVGAGVLIGVLATPAFGANRPLSLSILLGDSCVDGLAKPNTVIKFTIEDASGSLKGRDALMTQGDGSWYGCVDFFSDGLTTGDHIKVVDYDTHQQLSYTIPRITLAVDRVSNVVSGKAPAGMRLALEAADFNTPLFGKDPYDIVKHVTANGGGTYSHDFDTDGIDLMAAAQLELRASAQGGAISLRRDLTVPGLFVVINQAEFGGYLRPYFPIGITLKVGGSKVATGNAVGDSSGQFDGRVIDADGELYRVVGGEWLKAPALGIAWTVPNINGAASRHTNVLTGTCFAHEPWVVIAGYFGYANGMTNGSGAFSVDLSDQGGIAKGDQVVIGCFTKAGDVVEEELVVQ